MIWRSYARNQVLNADETIKRRLRLGDRAVADFVVTSTEPAPRRSGDEPASGLAATGFAWTSSVAENSDGPCGLQKVLDAMAAVGVGEGERNDLLRGLAAILHLGQVRCWKCRCGAQALLTGKNQRRKNLQQSDEHRLAKAAQIYSLGIGGAFHRENASAI